MLESIMSVCPAGMTLAFPKAIPLPFSPPVERPHIPSATWLPPKNLVSKGFSHMSVLVAILSGTPGMSERKKNAQIMKAIRRALSWNLRDRNPYSRYIASHMMTAARPAIGMPWQNRAEIHSRIPSETTPRAICLKSPLA